MNTKSIKSKIRSVVLRQVGATSTYPYRRYFDANMCIFIHIPKVAGSSVLDAIAFGDTVFRDHCTYRDFLVADKKRFESYFKFCFVREPISRLFSVYNYWKSGGNQMDDRYFQEIIAENNFDFSRFVLEYLDGKRIFEHRLTIPQYIFVYDHTRKCMVDFVGRYESIDQDFGLVMKTLGLKNGLKVINKSPFVGPNNLSREAREKIGELYKNDFALFGYDY